MAGRVGLVYSETTVYAAPAQFAGDAPYQIAIVRLDTGERITVRIAGPNAVTIGDRVVELTTDAGMPVFQAEFPGEAGSATK